MAFNISIHPTAPTVDMYGQPDASSAYSLSGHVAISLTSPFSFFETRRPARLMLQSVALTFEGQSEIFTPDTGYSGLRLCSILREIIREPVELSNEGHEESNEPCVWNIVFNIPLPGWLPATSFMGPEEVGVRYTLFAKAQCINLDEGPSNWGFSSFCNVFRSRVRSAGAQKAINIQRFISSPSAHVITPPLINYLVNSTPHTQAELKNGIPIEILSKIQVLASVPEYISLEDDVIPLTLRMRTKGLDKDNCKRIQVKELAVDIVQKEKCRHRPSSSYSLAFPLPSRTMQPPILPLIDPHPVSAVYDVGIFSINTGDESFTRAFSLLPPGENGVYVLADNNYVFADDAPSPLSPDDSNPTWYTMETTVPFHPRSSAVDAQNTFDWAGMPDLRPSSHGPQFSVKHELTIALLCLYDTPGAATPHQERLKFTVPITFGRVAPTVPSLRQSLQVQTQTQLQLQPSSPLSLPAYSQLYDSNGDRKIDYTVPLPLYTPPVKAVTLDTRELSPLYTSGASSSTSTLGLSLNTASFEVDWKAKEKMLDVLSLVDSGVPESL